MTLLQPTTVTGSFNEPTVTFASAGSLWMEVHDVSAREKYRSQEIQAAVSTRFKVRYGAASAAILPTWRLQVDGKTFNITGIRESQMRRWIELDAVARNDG